MVTENRPSLNYHLEKFSRLWNLYPWSFTDAYLEILQYFQTIPEIRETLSTRGDYVNAKPENVNILLIQVSGGFE